MAVALPLMTSQEWGAVVSMMGNSLKESEQAVRLPRPCDACQFAHLTHVVDMIREKILQIRRPLCDWRHIYTDRVWCMRCCRASLSPIKGSYNKSIVILFVSFHLLTIGPARLPGKN